MLSRFNDKDKQWAQFQAVPQINGMVSAMMSPPIFHGQQFLGGITFRQSMDGITVRDIRPLKRGNPFHGPLVYHLGEKRRSLRGQGLWAARCLCVISSRSIR